MDIENNRDYKSMYRMTKADFNRLEKLNDAYGEYLDAAESLRTDVTAEQRATLIKTQTACNMIVEIEVLELCKRIFDTQTLPDYVSLRSAMYFINQYAMMQQKCENSRQTCFHRIMV